MTFSEQIDRLVAKLTELTARDKVDWQETANLNTYLARVDKFVVTINKQGSEVFGGYSFQILDGSGRAIEGVMPLIRARKGLPVPTQTGSASATCTRSRVARLFIPKKWFRTFLLPSSVSLSCRCSSIPRKIKVYL